MPIAGAAPLMQPAPQQMMQPMVGHHVVQQQPVGIGGLQPLPMQTVPQYTVSNAVVGQQFSVVSNPQFVSTGLQQVAPAQPQPVPLAPIPQYVQSASSVVGAGAPALAGVAAIQPSADVASSSADIYMDLADDEPEAETPASVLEAIQRDGSSALAAASEELRGDREFIMAAASCCGLEEAVKHATEALRTEMFKDHDFMLKAAAEVGSKMLKHAAPELRGSREFMLQVAALST